MGYCLTVVAHHTFVEYMFGHSDRFREPSGALQYSPLPRDSVSRAGILFVEVTIGIWFVFMVIGCGGQIIVFSPVLLLPAFVIPMVIMYAPSLLLDNLADSLRNWGDVSVVLGEDMTFGETVLILKGATTQVISLAMVALPAISFLAGRGTWTGMVKELLSTSLNFQRIFFDFQFFFAWPSFELPRLGIYLGVSSGLISMRYILQGMTALFRLIDYFTPILGERSPWEIKIDQAFDWVTWRPFREISDRLRTAITATVNARHGFSKVMYGGFPQVIIGPRLGGLINKAPNSLLVALGPVLVATFHPLCRVFASGDDKEVKSFVSDEACMSYNSVITRNGPSEKCTGETLEAILKCVWLQSLNMSFCTEVTGTTSDISELKRLRTLALSMCVGITGSTKDLGKLKDLRVLSIDNCTGIMGSSRDFTSLKKLTTLRFMNIPGIAGNTSDFKGLVQLEQLVIDNCTGIHGAIEDLCFLNKLRTLRLSKCTGITGSLYVFLQHSRLSWLDVSENTGITGSIRHLQNLRSLSKLFIGGCTGIEGSTADLQKFPALTMLKMKGCTGIAGTTMDLAALNLQKLELDGCTRISGASLDEEAPPSDNDVAFKKKMMSIRYSSAVLKD